jgi:hypothetical protein
VLWYYYSFDQSCIPYSATLCITLRYNPEYVNIRLLGSNAVRTCTAGRHQRFGGTLVSTYKCTWRYLQKANIDIFTAVRTSNLITQNTTCILLSRSDISSCWESMRCKHWLLTKLKTYSCNMLERALFRFAFCTLLDHNGYINAFKITIRPVP